MPDEPNPKMDELLRRYARERRQQADFTLHPGVRKTLLAEAARQHSARAFTPLWDRLKRFWPQLAFGSGFAAVLVIAVVSLRHGPGTPKGPPAKTERVVDQKLVKVEPVSAAAEGPASTEEPLLKLAAPEPRLGRQAKARAAADPVAAADSMAAAKVPASRGLTFKQMERAANLKELGSALRVRFVELRPETRLPVLTAFQVEQNGSDLLIVDRDGSTYAGKLTLVTNSEARAQPPQTALLGLADLSRNASEYLFYAQGTNVTFAKPMVIEGQYFDRTNIDPAPEQTFSFADAAPPVQPSATTPPGPKYQRAMIGRATIGQTNQIPLSAVSLDP